MAQRPAPQWAQGWQPPVPPRGPRRGRGKTAALVGGGLFAGLLVIGALNGNNSSKDTGARVVVPAAVKSSRPATSAAASTAASKAPAKATTAPPATKAPVRTVKPSPTHTTVKPAPTHTTVKPRVVRTTPPPTTQAPVAMCASHTVGTCAAGSPHPAGAMAQCKDTTYSYSAHFQGTCSRHGGVEYWYQ